MNKLYSVKEYIKTINLFDFFIIFFCLFVKYVNQVFFFNSFMTYAYVCIICILCILKIISERTLTFLKKEKYKILFLFILSIIYYIPFHKIDLFIALFIAAAIVHLGITRYIFYWGVSSLIIYSIILMSFYTGLVVDHVTMTRNVGGEIFVRSSLGLDHPTYSICFLLPLLCLGIYVKKAKTKIMLLAFLIIFAAITFHATNSRTTLFTVLVGFVIIVVSFFQKKCKAILILCSFSPFISFLFSVLVAKFFSDNSLLNKFFSSRPLAWNKAFDTILLFGPSQYVQTLFNTGGSIDNFTLYMLCGYGIIIALIILLLLFLLCLRTSIPVNGFRNFYTIYNPSVCLIVGIYMFYGISERHVLDFGFGLLTPLLYLGLIYPDFFKRRETELL